MNGKARISDLFFLAVTFVLILDIIQLVSLVFSGQANFGSWTYGWGLTGWVDVGGIVWTEIVMDVLYLFILIVYKLGLVMDNIDRSLTDFAMIVFSIVTITDLVPRLLLGAARIP